jgi:ATP-dependent Zn protease
LKALLDDNYEATMKALGENRAALDAIASDLIARETISGDEVREIVAKQRPAAGDNGQQFI